MPTTQPPIAAPPALDTLPGDDVRQLLWRFAERYDLQMVVQSARAVARGPAARLVAAGARGSHAWSAEKSALLEAFDAAGITALFMEPEDGGFIEGPKNLALALAAFELAWVDAGAATCALAGDLALAPIHECGTAAQRRAYMRRCVPPPAGSPGAADGPLRGAFCLTEPLPYVGVDTGVLAGRVRVAAWEPGCEPLLQVEKRGRFITNMDFAGFVTVAVDSDDQRLRGSCIIIIEAGDPGTFDRGAPTRKLVHQLSSTRDPIFSLQVPAGRIVGGYTVRDGVIVPRYSHGTVIESVFRRTRVTVGLMTAAKLLSAVEPIIRYQRERYRGGGALRPGSPRYDLGLQQKEDALQRLVDVWATGEAAAALGFATARFCDAFDALERRKEAALAEQGIQPGRAAFRYLRGKLPEARELLELSVRPAAERDRARQAALEADPVVRFLVEDALVNVLVPACKLWSTGHGANVMREAVSLMGGYGITEDCPGFLGQKWMDAQLEATYEGPEAVQRRHLTASMTSELFLTRWRQWIVELRAVAGRRPGTGACLLGSAMELWLWTLRHLLGGRDADGKPLYRDQRQGVTFPMADALCWLLASRQQILDVLELEARGPEHPTVAAGLAGYVQFFTDLCHAQAAAAAGEVGRVCAELVYGYERHPAWERDGVACYGCDEIDDLETVMPGIAACAQSMTDVVGSDGSHPAKAGPCASSASHETFARLRTRLDGCLTGARLAKDRAARALRTVMIPEALDYPQ